MLGVLVERVGDVIRSGSVSRFFNVMISIWD